jgi:hypothetical protein
MGLFDDNDEVYEPVDNDAVDIYVGTHTPTQEPAFWVYDYRAGQVEGDIATFELDLGVYPDGLFTMSRAEIEDLVASLTAHLVATA